MKKNCLLFLCLFFCNLLFANSYAAIQCSKKEAYVLKIENSAAGLYSCIVSDDCVKNEKLVKHFISGLSAKKFTSVHSFLSPVYSGFILSDETINQSNEFSLLYKSTGSEFEFLSFNTGSFYKAIEFYYLTEKTLNVFFRAETNLIQLKIDLVEKNIISTEPLFEGSEIYAFNFYKGKLLLTSYSDNSLSFYFDSKKIYELNCRDVSTRNFRVSIIDEKIYVIVFNSDNSFDIYKAEYDARFTQEKIYSNTFNELNINQILDFSVVNVFDSNEVFYLKYKSEDDSSECVSFVLFTNEKILYKSQNGLDSFISCLSDDSSVFFLSQEKTLEEIKFEISGNKYLITSEYFELKEDFIYLNPVFYKYKLPLFYDLKKSNLVFFETRKNEYFYKPFPIQNDFSFSKSSGFIQSNFFNGKCLLFFINENQIVSLEY